MTYQEGDSNHIGVHNDLVTSVQDLASGMGVDVDLPPTRQLGDIGHVGDHNTIQAALDKISAEGSAGASWAQVVSAPDAVSSSYYDDKGGQWQYYEWNAAGTFSVELSGGLVWVLCVGGGDGGYASDVANAAAGQPGLVNEGLWEFGPGTHTVTVGKAGQMGNLTETTKLSRPSSIGDYGTQGVVVWGEGQTGRGASEVTDNTGYKSRITGDELEYAPGRNGWKRPGRAGMAVSQEAEPGAVIIATRIDVPTLPPAPPRLDVAPVTAKPVSISGPAVQEWLVRDKQNNRKVVYFLPGNTGTARSLALTEDGAAALEARRELLDAIATTEVPEDFDGDPVTLLPKKLRGELTGFVEVRATPQPEAVFSVTLGAGVLPGVMVGSGGTGGRSSQSRYPAGGGGSAGVIGAGCHVPVILPVQGTATYTITVGSTTVGIPQGQPTTVAVQNQTPFAAAIGGGRGLQYETGYAVGARSGGSGGGGAGGGYAYVDLGGRVPGQGNRGGVGNGYENNPCGGGGGYGSEGGSNGDGGAGFDLATALNLNPNDGITGQFLNLISVDGFIAGGGSGGGTVTAGGGVPNGDAKDHTGAGGGGDTGTAAPGGNGGAGAVYIITDPT